MRVMFDVDGVLADFTYGFSSVLARLGVVDRPWTTREQQTWDWRDARISEEDDAAAWRAVREDPTFWSSLPSLASEQELVRVYGLSQHAHVYFVTSRVGKACKEQTETWLLARGVWNPTVVVCDKKAAFARAVGADFAIDDNTVNLLSIAADSPAQAFALDQPYNRLDHAAHGAHKVRRVASVGEFLDAVDAVS